MSSPHRLVIQRSRDYTGLARRLNVYLDGIQIGSVKSGDTETFMVAPGQHSLYVRMDWKRSDALSLNLESGTTTNLLCGSTITGWKIILSLFYMLSSIPAFYVRRVG